MDKRIDEIYIPFKGEKKQIYLDLLPYCQMIFSKFGYGIIDTIYDLGYRKIPENAVVIDKNENPCLSCPVPEDIQRDVDCSTICGAVRLGIDWQNQCKVLVKENKQLTKALAEKGKETAEKFAERLKSLFDEYGKYIGYHINEIIDEICKEITEGKV